MKPIWKPQKILHYISAQVPPTHSPPPFLGYAGCVSIFTPSRDPHSSTRRELAVARAPIPRIVDARQHFFVLCAPSMQVAEKGTQSSNEADRL
jgi:hypothetical protein